MVPAGRCSFLPEHWLRLIVQFSHVTCNDLLKWNTNADYFLVFHPPKISALPLHFSPPKTYCQKKKEQVLYSKSMSDIPRTTWQYSHWDVSASFCTVGRTGDMAAIFVFRSALQTELIVNDFFFFFSWIRLFVLLFTDCCVSGTLSGDPAAGCQNAEKLHEGTTVLATHQPDRSLLSISL